MRIIAAVLLLLGFITYGYLMRTILAMLSLCLMTFAAHAQTQHCIASVYSVQSSGNKTASGQQLNDGALTAAHRSLKFGTKVRVTNKRNGKSCVVTINDRGPFIQGRCIDLSVASAHCIGLGWSIVPVTVDVVSGEGNPCVGGAALVQHRC